MNEAAIYTQCLLALENSGNYSDLYKAILNDGRLCPVVFRNYAVYATRGMLDDLYPARDNLFYYDLGLSMEDVEKEYVEPTVVTSEDTTSGDAVPDETTAPEE